MVEDKDKIMSSGFRGNLSKPIDPQNFIKQIEIILHSNHNEEADENNLNS